MVEVGAADGAGLRPPAGDLLGLWSRVRVEVDEAGVAGIKAGEGADRAPRSLQLNRQERLLTAGFADLPDGHAAARPPARHRFDKGDVRHAWVRDPRHRPQRAKDAVL